MWWEWNRQPIKFTIKCSIYHFIPSPFPQSINGADVRQAIIIILLSTNILAIYRVNAERQYINKTHIEVKFRSSRRAALARSGHIIRNCQHSAFKLIAINVIIYHASGSARCLCKALRQRNNLSCIHRHTHTRHIWMNIIQCSHVLYSRTWARSSGPLATFYYSLKQKKKKKRRKLDENEKWLFCSCHYHFSRIF